MTRLLKYIIGAVLVTLVCTVARAQKKYEREYSLKKSAVPAAALEFIGSVFRDVRVNWYGEESLTGKTIEAKLTSKGRRFSIEFSTEGQIQDVEILSRFSRIPDPARKAIDDGLKKSFKTFRVTKTQIQWTGSASQLKKAIQDEALPGGITIRYELIVKGRKTGLQKYYEVLCNDRGGIDKILEIVQRNADNLIY